MFEYCILQDRRKNAMILYKFILLNQNIKSFTKMWLIEALRFKQTFLGWIILFWRK